MSLNLALNKKAVSSSNETSNLTPNYVTDGNTSSSTSRWSSGSFTNGGQQWIYIDLTQLTEFDTIKIYWEKANATIYRIEISNDANTWNSIHRNTNGRGGVEVIDFISKKTSRYVRVYCEKNNNLGWATVSIYEIEIYNEAIAKPTSINLALNKSAVSSSNESNALKSIYVVDGRNNTRWASKSFINGVQWIYVDLEQITEFNNIKINWHTAFATVYTIQILNDYNSWESVYRTTTGKGGIETITLNSKQKSRYVNIYCEQNNRLPANNVSIYEIEIYNINSTKVLSSSITINSINNLPVAYIKFDNTKKKLIASFSNNIADLTNKYDYVTIKVHALIDPTLTNPSIIATLVSNTNNIDFIKKINEAFLDYGYILQIICSNKALNKVNISNLQGKEQVYTLTNNIEYFKITDKGLAPFTPVSLLKDTTIFVGNTDGFVGTLIIKFDPDSKTIKASSSYTPIGNVAETWAEASAFIYKLYDENRYVVKKDYVYAYDYYTIYRDGYSVDLANSLNGTHFEYGYSLEIYAPVRDYWSIYKVPVAINNLTFRANSYWKFNDTETVKITPLGLELQSDSPLGNIQYLSNIIIVNSPNNKSIVQIYFDITSKKLLVASSSIRISYSGTRDYFIITLKDNLGNQKTIARIREDKKGDDFADALNKFPFEFGDTITLQCLQMNKISILNYPSYNNTYKSADNNPKTFTITNGGLILKE